ncbi:unnamed protein product [Orchesella dallaii]|uniref:Uncharacterized protein n=1 Tax=Orchesella dallaii TaxID=48710 RepID=A0ABP1RPH5_9HEXA
MVEQRLPWSSDGKIMSDLYSEILEGSCDSILSGGGEKLHSVLKNEVGVVQGARRLKAVQDDPNWIESSEADGYGDTGTRKVKIEGRILKSQRILEKKKKHSQIEHKSMMLLLNWFCLQNRIPLLSSNIGQERSGRGRRSKSRSKAPTEDQNTPGGDGGADRNSNRKSQRTGKKGSTVGGAGGGKRPHRQSSTSEPDSAKSLQVSDSSEQVVSSSAEVSTEINDHNRERKLKKHEKSENEEHTTNRAKTFKLNEQGKLPADDIFSSSTNLVQDHQKKSYGNESSSRRKKSKTKHDVVETSDSFSISKSSVSQSFEEKVRTGNSDQITAVDIPTSSTNLAQNHPNKDNGKENKSSSRRKKSKRKQDVVETSDIFSIPTSSVSQSFEGKVQAGKSVQIEEPGGGESVNPAKNKQVKEYRRRSSNRKKLKSRKTLPQAGDPVLIINLSVISKIVIKACLQKIAVEIQELHFHQEMDECKKIVLFPDCFNPPPGTSPQKQMFTECHIPPNSGGRWRNVPSIFQPTIFQKKNNDYIQIMLLGTSNCQLGGGDPPFPPSTITTYDKNKPIFDCQKKEYIIPTEFDVDDCFNPILKKKPGSHLPYQSVSVIIEPKPNSKKVSCCVAYGVPSKIEGEQLAVLCNKPSFNDFWDRCQSRKHQADYPSSLSKTYYDVWFSLEKKVRRVMEKDSKIVQCLCRHIPYVKEMEPNFKLKERQCRDYILTWKIKG